MITKDPQGNTIAANNSVQFTDALTGQPLVGVVVSIEGGILLNVRGKRTTEQNQGNFQIHANQVQVTQ